MQSNQCKNINNRKVHPMTKVKITTGDETLYEGTAEQFEKAVNKIGHNATAAGYIKRWLNILSEQDTLSEDLKELKAEIKANGFDKNDLKAMTLVVKEHRQIPEKPVREKANQFFADSGGQYLIFAD
jgi:uncharacterized protein (UPF0335 family)